MVVFRTQSHPQTERAAPRASSRHILPWRSARAPPAAQRQHGESRESSHSGVLATRCRRRDQDGRHTQSDTRRTELVKAWSVWWQPAVLHTRVNIATPHAGNLDARAARVKVVQVHTELQCSCHQGGAQRRSTPLPMWRGLSERRLTGKVSIEGGPPAAVPEFGCCAVQGTSTTTAHKVTRAREQAIECATAGGLRAALSQDVILGVREDRPPLGRRPAGSARRCEHPLPGKFEEAAEVLFPATQHTPRTSPLAAGAPAAPCARLTRDGQARE